MSEKAYPTHKIKPSEEKLEFRIEEIAFNNHYNVNDPHAHDYYEIFLFKANGGTHTIDFNAKEIKANSIHLVIPGQVHQVGREGSCTGLVMMFSKDYLQGSAALIDTINSFPFIRPQDNPFIKEIEKEKFDFVFDLVAKILEENGSTGFNAKQIIQSYLNIILLKTQELFADQKIEISQQTNKLLNFISNNISHTLRAEDVATSVGISFSSLNELTKKETGKTIKGLIKECLIREIKRSLLLDVESSKTIAYELNFTDPSYFTKYVKKELGCTPNEFRQKFLS